METAVICDIDGTLALCEQGREKSYYYDRDFMLDKLNEPIAEIVRKFYMDVDQMIIVSGRKEKNRRVTEAWLEDNDIPYDMLLMRKDDDNGPDNLTKCNIYLEHIREKFNVFFVLDDRDRVVKMWRDQGLTCLQVAEGDF